MAVDAGVLRMLQRLERLEQDVARLRTIEVPRGVLHREVIAGTATPSATLSPIPGGYTDLSIKVSGRCRVAAASDILYVRFNGDTTGGNYVDERLMAQAAAASGLEALTLGYGQIGYLPGLAGSGSGTWAVGSARVWVPNYAGAVLYHDWQSDWRLNIGNATGQVYTGRWSGSWASANAITSVTVGLTASYFEPGTVITISGDP
jgi:hypothetical protein